MIGLYYSSFNNIFIYSFLHKFFAVSDYPLEKQHILVDFHFQNYA